MRNLKISFRWMLIGVLVCVQPSLFAEVRPEQASRSGTIQNSEPGGLSGSFIADSLASSSWSWELTLKRQTRRLSPTSYPVSWSQAASLSWVPEIDAAGNHLGWNLTLGDASDNQLIDATIPHGPQPFEFYGWQFLPVIDGPLGLQREWRLKGGILRVFVLDYALDGTSLVQLRIRCEWFPERVSSTKP